MNMRYKILEVVSKNPCATMQEITESVEYDAQKTTWSVRDCAKNGLLSVRRDDVTGLPGYTLTEAGKARLAEGPDSRQGVNLKMANRVGPPPSGKPEDTTKTAEALEEAVSMFSERDDELTKLRDAIRNAYIRIRGHVPLSSPDNSPFVLLEVIEAGICNLVKRLDVICRQIESKDDELHAQQAQHLAELVRLQDEINRLQSAATDHGSPQVATSQYGYLISATKREPMTTRTEQKAREAALSAIRAGAQRADVFALIPVGTARKEAVWKWCSE